MTPHPGDRLSALLDGELHPSDAAEVRAHVDGCPACASELDEVAGARSAVRRLPWLDRPDVRQPKPRTALLVPLAFAAAAAVSFAVLAPERRVTPPVADFVLSSATFTANNAEVPRQ